jgi:hypothetical protein
MNSNNLSGLTPIWLISLALILGTAIVVMIPAAISEGDAIKASDWIGFSGNVVAGAMTLIAGVIAWFAVQRQIAVAREVAFAKEGEVWTVLRDDLENVVTSVDFAWKNLDRAMMQTENIVRAEWRKRQAVVSMRVLPKENQIKRLETFSEGLGPIKRRQLALVFYDLNQIALLGKQLQTTANENKGDEDETGFLTSDIFGSDMGILQIFMTNFCRHLKPLDVRLAQGLSDRHQSLVPEVKIGAWANHQWTGSQMTEKQLFGD